MNFHQYRDREHQAEALALRVASQLRTALERNGVARLAVPGGNTPKRFLSQLAKQELDWEAVRIVLTDERQVEEASQRSNLRFIKEHLGSVAERVQIIPLYKQTSNTLSLVADDVQAFMLPLDVCVLGMGEDGHFASLFPHADNLATGLDPNSDHVLLPIAMPTLPESRISLTLKSILSAEQVHLLIQGDTKKDIVKFNAKHVLPSMPVASLLSEADEKLFIHYAD